MAGKDEGPESPKMVGIITDFDTGIRVALLNSNRLSQEKKYYHLVIILLSHFGIKIIPLL